MDLATAGRQYSEYKDAEISTIIHPDDVMYNTGKPFYYTVGESAISAIFTGLTSAWCSEVLRFLDLPCGHGRVSRQLVAAFPDAQAYFCDIERSGVDFCTKIFGGKGIYSQPNLLEVELPKDLSLIWIGSLFTHLDRERTSAWLVYLCDHLADNGILVATFHGLFAAKHRVPGGNPDIAKIRREFADTGYGYAPYDAEGVMDNYGFSLSTPAALMDIATGIKGTKIVNYTERGWANNHDVMVISRNDRLLPFGK